MDQKQIVRYSLRIEAELLEQLRTAAKFHARSLNQELRQIIREHLRKFQKEAAPGLD